MFSLKKGRPIAKFTTGKNANKHTLNIIDDDNNNNERNEYKTHEKLLPVPDITKRQVLYITGPSGSGKSTMAGQYIKTFKTLYPKLDIYIFSRKKSEPEFDKYKPYYIPIDEELYINPIDITTELKKGALIVFDDTNTISDDKIRKAITKLISDVLEVGRSFNIYCIITSHLINGNDRKETRIIMNELDSMIIFPRACNKYAVNYALNKYFGIDKKNIEKILNLNSRWCLINKNYPQYVLYENGAYMI